MSRTMDWKCDGCDVRQSTKVDELPQSWATISVTIDGFLGHPVGKWANGTNSFDLCPSCQGRLRGGANPLQWERAPLAPKEIRA